MINRSKIGIDCVLGAETLLQEQTSCFHWHMKPTMTSFMCPFSHCLHPFAFDETFKMYFCYFQQPVASEEATFTNPTAIKPEEYFNKHIPLENRDVGRPKEVSSKIQKFRATLWLCENYPLSMQEQVLPIIDLMAISNAHFAKLRDFIMLQLPAGFPIKIGWSIFFLHFDLAYLTEYHYFFLLFEHLGQFFFSERMSYCNVCVANGLIVEVESHC